MWFYFGLRGWRSVTGGVRSGTNGWLTVARTQLLRNQHGLQSCRSTTRPGNQKNPGRFRQDSRWYDFFLIGILSNTWGHSVPTLAHATGRLGWPPQGDARFCSVAVSSWVNAEIDFRVMRFGDGRFACRHATPRGNLSHVFRKHIPRRRRVGRAGFVEYPCAEHS